MLDLSIHNLAADCTSITYNMHAQTVVHHVIIILYRMLHWATKALKSALIQTILFLPQMEIVLSRLCVAVF